MGVQYHPEFTLGDMAVIVRRYGRRLIGEGFFADETARDAYIGGPANARPRADNKPLAWRYGIDETVLNPAIRTRSSRTGSRIRYCRHGRRGGEDERLSDRHVVVTGGTGALGTAVVSKLIEDGAVCHVPYRNEEEAKRFPHSTHKKRLVDRARQSCR